MKAEEKSKKKEKPQALAEKYYKNKVADFTYLYNFGYCIYKELGRGGYGIVYKACRYAKGKQDKSKKYAIKINFQTVTPELIYSEIAFCNLVKNKENMPQLVDLFICNDKIHIIQEYFKYKPFISFFASFEIKDIKHYLYQLLKGIKVLKDTGIYHRDIKPGNFLYNPDTKKGIIIDFGLSELDPEFVKQMSKLEKEGKQSGNQEQYKEIARMNEFYQNISKCIKNVGNNKIGTESFMPLESILRYQNQNYSVDIWPVGVVFLQFVLRKYNIFNNVRMLNKPKDLKNNYFITFIMELVSIFGTEQVTRMCEKYGYKVNFPRDLQKHQIQFKDIVHIKNFDNVSEDLLNRLLALDYTQRISVEDALNHQFFDEIKNEVVISQTNISVDKTN